jgi:flagellar hook-associated protein 2
MAALQSLGLGSSGVLTLDIVDKLKAADSASIIKPIERKIATESSKDKALSDLKSLVSSLSDKLLTLNDPTLYTSKKAKISGDSVNVTAKDSSIEQSFEVEVITLATRDINQSSGFASKNEPIQDSMSSLEINGKDIIINDDDTLESIVDKINSNSDLKVKASILNTGGDNPYKLILKSEETGKESELKITSNMNFSQVGDGPKDAVFKIDGIEITKSSNTIDDALDGVELTLTKLGTTSVEIGINSEKIEEKFNEFVTDYNAIISKVSDLTKYDQDTKSAGVFQGNSQIRSIKTSISDAFSMHFGANGKTIADFGFETNRDGTLSLDSSKLKESLSKDSNEIKNFFLGDIDNKGAFRLLNDSLFNIGTKSSGVLKSLQSNIDDRQKSLIESQERAQKRLDDRYDIMIKKFAAYDGIMGKLDSQAQALTSMIDASKAKK